jgi:hypothetical protein
MARRSRYRAIADPSRRTTGFISAAFTAAAMIPMFLAVGPVSRKERTGTPWPRQYNRRS